MLARLAILALLLAGAAPAAHAQKLETEDQKTIYALGLAVARNLQAFDLTPEEVTILQAGLTAGLSGQKPAVDLEAYGPKLDPLAQARTGARLKREREAAAVFLQSAAAVSGAKTTDSGLVYRELKAGSGDPPTPKDRVKVHYTGKLRDGKVFDSWDLPGHPTEFDVTRMIPCWREGVSMMRPGGKAELTCPADLAAGDAGVPPGKGDMIPGGAAVRFEIELISVDKNAAVEPKAAAPPGAKPPAN